MDEVQVVNLGPEGRQTRLVKLLKHPAAAAQDASSAATAEPEVIQEQIGYDVRLMAEHEAIEVSKCAFKSHGYSFFDDHIYYPDRLVEMNRTGEMASYVAVTEGGEFMGHVARPKRTIGGDER